MAHLLIVELPGGNDVDILRAAIDRGDVFSFLSADLDLYRRHPLAGVAISLARAQIEVPDFDIDEVERQVLALDRRRPIDAVLCLIDTRIIEAARLARRLGVPHLSVDSAVLLRDKFDVRLRLASCGFAQPDFALAETADGLAQAVERIGLPVMIKPSDGHGSQHIVALRDALDPLPPLPTGIDYGLGVRSSDRVIAEALMHGTVVACDTLTVNGRHHLLGITEKIFFDGAARFVIRGGCFQPNRPEFASIEQHVVELLDAVGFDHGATHTELMLTADGPRLIEINPRLVGAKLPRLLGYTLGRSIHADLIGVHLGETPDLSAPASPPLVGVIRWIVAEQSGLLEAIELPPLQDPRIRCIDMLKRTGDVVQPPVQNADRIGYVVVCAASREEAEALADRFVSLTRVRVRVHEFVAVDARSEASGAINEPFYRAAMAALR